MSQRENADISVNAAVLAAALRLPPEEVLRRIRMRQITAVHEHGVDEDLGRERLIFYAGTRRVQLLIDEMGQVIDCRVARVHHRSGAPVAASTAAPATDASRGSDEPEDLEPEDL